MFSPHGPPSLCASRNERGTVSFAPCVYPDILHAMCSASNRTHEKDAKAFPTRSHKHVRWLKGLLSIPHLVRTLRSSTIVPSPRSKLGL